MKIKLILFSSLFSAITFAQNLRGKAEVMVMESERPSNVRFGNVQAYDSNNKLINSVLTDEEGNYSMDFKDTGTYHLKVMYAGYEVEEEVIKITEDQVNDFSLNKDASKKARVLEEKEYKLDTRYMGEVAYLSNNNAQVHNITKGKGLTAGEINDFAKWQLWNDYLKSDLLKYQKVWKLNPQARFTVQVLNTEKNPVVGATIKLFDKGNSVIWEAISDNTGKAELWGKLNDITVETGKIEVSYLGLTKEIKRPKLFTKGINKIKLDIDCGATSNEVEIAFLIDATGSMGDEINFIKRDLNQVMYKAQNLFKGVNIKYGSVFYRDKTEDYMTKHKDFTNVLSEALVFIDDQYAKGGGDMPEALDEGLAVAIDQLSWSENARTKLLFVILDAPAHSDENTIQRLEKLARKAAKKGIKIVPITGSGINKSGEYLMRSLALCTNGTYLFLTDHSGIGVAHIKPTVDEFDVQLLTERLTNVIKTAVYYPECDEITPHLPLNYPDSVVNYTLDQGQVYVDADTLGHSDSTRRDSSRVTQRENSIETIEWKFYPNPTRDYVTVETSEEIEFIYVTDLSGKLLQKVEFNGARNTRIYLGDYPVGIYLLRYPIGKQWVTGKVVLAR
ncbi:MAG: T9SS type A sorting domain-containing protein [Flavobacteriales bacterium]|jgi:hypothetical protein|nr:T9SS type A sorting domain-containing protein [Flavobacteriales bacterium]